jgi:hypothetical protein
MALLAVPAVAAADEGAYVAQDGSETRLAFVSGCFSGLAPNGLFSSLCADGPAQSGPRIALHPGPAMVRLDRVAGKLVVQVGGKPVPVARTDDTHWTAELPAGLVNDASLGVFGRGGSPDTNDSWDAFYVATVDAPPAPAAAPEATVTRLRARGRSVAATLGLRNVPAGRFVAYVVLDGRRVSTRASGTLGAADRVGVTLRRKTWRAARHHGRLVVRITAAGLDQTRRLALPH